MRNLCFHEHSEKSLLKPLEIAVFALKMTYFWYEKGPLWTTPTSKFEFFYDIGRKFNKFSESPYFFEKSSDLVELHLFLYLE